MNISAKVENSQGKHEVSLRTNDQTHSITIPPKSSGYGSSANGGELLLLALATCYCNDIYREAAKRGIRVEKVEVEVGGDFGAEGDPAANVSYQAKVVSDASKEEIEDLMWHTDKMAEIQNTLRVQTQVILNKVEASTA
jgi:organic hydroperoxide reductase OsmC/OhrA